MKSASLKYKKQISIAALVTFIVAEAAFYPMLHLAPSEYFTPFAYATVALAFAFSFFSLFVGAEKSDWLVRLGLFFTLGADFCLVILNPAQQLVGVSIFIAAQLCYAAYIAVLSYERKRGLFKPQLYIRAAVTVIAVLAAIAVLGDNTDALAIVSVVYFSQLACNLVFSLLTPRLALFSVGLVFFVLCDLSIGFDSLAMDYIGATEGSFLDLVLSIDVNKAWIFYPPSQVLISASLLKLPKNKNNKD